MGRSFEFEVSSLKFEVSSFEFEVVFEFEGSSCFEFDVVLGLSCFEFKVSSCPSLEYPYADVVGLRAQLLNC